MLNTRIEAFSSKLCTSSLGAERNTVSLSTESAILTTLSLKFLGQPLSLISQRCILYTILTRLEDKGVSFIRVVGGHRRQHHGRCNGPMYNQRGYYDGAVSSTII
jgi:hypothetical protein